MKIVFYSLQGLGNSIVNFPILHRLRQRHEVRVVAFNNGSSAFFKAFHPDSIGVNSRTELLQLARSMNVEASFTCYPTWRRELSASLLTRAPKKFLARYISNPWARGLWDYRVDGDSSLHHLENNLRLLEDFPEVEARHIGLDQALDISNVPKGKILGAHPTASTPVKYFPMKFWQELLRESLDEYDQIQLFCGTSAVETEFCTKLRASLSSPKITCNSGMNFRDLTSAIAGTSQFIGTDSALMHLAAMMGKPVLGLWSFANYRVIYPYGDHVQVYLPEENLASKNHEYPKEVPEYLQRASGLRAIEIMKGSTPVKFTLTPRFVKPVRFYTY